MNSNKPKPVNFADLLYERGVRFVSGKFFRNDEEIKDIKKYLWRTKEIGSLISTVDDTKAIVDVFIEKYGDNGLWPEMKIVKDARNVKSVKKIDELCFPFTLQQLMIIRLLIEGKEEVAIILCGVGGSGKSTYANIIKQIFDNDVAALNLEQLSDKYELATGVNSRLIYSDELNSSDLNNGQIKTLISKQEVTINGKFERPFKARWQGTMFFSCNKPPKLDLDDTGILRRIVYYSMNEKIKNPDLTMQKRVYSYEDLVDVVAVALQLDMTNWFSLFARDTRQLLRVNNSVYLCSLGKNIDATDYEDYKSLCNKKGYRPYSQERFESIKDLLIEWKEADDDEQELPF